MLHNMSVSTGSKTPSFFGTKSSVHASWDAVMSAPIMPNTTTENGCAAFSSTGSSCLDLFASVVRDTPTATVVEKFNLAWIENPHLALQILMNLRDRDGKQEKRVSFDAFASLKASAPRTYLKNLQYFIDHGCWKDALVLYSMGPHSLVKDPELQLFAAQLAEDSSALSTASSAGSPISLSLAGKWAPTEGCHFDKTTKAAHKIAAFLGKNMKQYRQMNTALRTQLDVLERHESLGTWDEIKFSHVPATAMKKQKNAFQKHLPVEFKSYLADVMAGKAKMNSKAVQPHELVRHYMHHGYPDATTDAQWHSMIARLATAGLFKDCVAVSDVSGSMAGVPMEVSVALGLVVSELTAPPFKNRVITFSEVPTWHNVIGSTLHERVNSLSKAAWGGSTNFIAVFEMLLLEAQTYRLRPDQMIKKVFVFTDMQFNSANSASKSPYNTAFYVISAKYAAAGYALPQIVFWNLRETHSSFPVQKDTPGVAMMSGFSAEMLKLFLDDVEMTPYNMMIRAVSKYRVTVMDETASVSTASVSTPVVGSYAAAVAVGGAGVAPPPSSNSSSSASSSASSASSSAPAVVASSSASSSAPAVVASSSASSSSGSTPANAELIAQIAAMQTQLATLVSKLSA